MAELTSSSYRVAVSDNSSGIFPFSCDLFSLFGDPKFLQGVILGIILFYLIMYYNSRKRMNKRHNCYEEK
ncbi:hypothetical protein, variant 4 [Plasmodium yoelii 17X]|uniref:Uncharacterized protein n=3 Tax=Plasmodium yoelii TaxID=5861 RepID=A0AAE9WMS7_PLAYO|nr:conserved Plasmodium protein, unknown function [Plasmodium yoelii]ETB60496.1 hypothetical protein YYC_02780 [Plasmodium yoelii 17X]WBY56531.1 hypothetical protein Py17XNL_000801602 [Plasmodium yoelii yoelii]ETB60497.1 hypothetical protein, variant 1 [Plasmodium yoelii 17X]ETB60498.1 hypothetical protein, variant 2 [Plasmodium yoelii 17X]ETB60499.1 hypothetical protein, variant 3 [Plasmodium yoelii 17X]|eukprot:XP_022811888.1 conserved Plasmodium protein, unknown function [Plasmodium yoelii]